MKWIRIKIWIPKGWDDHSGKKKINRLVHQRLVERRIPPPLQSVRITLELKLDGTMRRDLDNVLKPVIDALCRDRKRLKDAWLGRRIQLLKEDNFHVVKELRARCTEDEDLEVGQAWLILGI